MQQLLNARFAGIIIILALSVYGKIVNAQETDLKEIETTQTENQSTNKQVNELPVFPGAEGFGTTTIAGRGGAVCKVSNLQDKGPGSLRACIAQEGPRTVIFETGGTITLDSPLYIQNPFISIFGQTAPGSGILVRTSIDTKGPTVKVQTHDVLIQHMRIRANSSKHETCCRDAIQVGNEKPGRVFNIVLDHNSFSWGTDEIVDVWYDTNNVTLSYNIIAEGLHNNTSNEKGPAGRGMIVGSRDSHSISIHHNLFAHTYQRNPMIVTGGIVDITNNIIYHWISRGGVQSSRYDGQKVNWVKNNFVARVNNKYVSILRNKLNSITGNKIDLLKNNSEDKQESWVSWGDIILNKGEYPLRAYFEENLGHHRRNNKSQEWTLAYTDWNTPYDPDLGYHSDTRYPAPEVTEYDANTLEDVLLDLVGATKPERDSVDARIIDDVISRKGKMPDCVAIDDLDSETLCKNNAGGWPTMSPGKSRTDSDNDGIPDGWEIANGTNPELKDDYLDVNNNGYSNLEEWVYSLSSHSQD